MSKLNEISTCEVCGHADLEPVLDLGPHPLCDDLFVDEALGLGLATKVVPADALSGEVRQMAQRLAAGPTVAFGAIRRSLEYSASHDLAASLTHEAEMMALTGATQDHRSSVDAFVAKQKPVFEGRRRPCITLGNVIPSAGYRDHFV